jgi:hypothetical protein
MTKHDLVRKTLPLLRRFLQDSARRWLEKHSTEGRRKMLNDPTAKSDIALSEFLYQDLANLRMWLRDTAGFILRVEYQRYKPREDVVTIKEEILGSTHTFEVWTQKAPKADNPIPVTDTPGPSSSHYGISPSSHDTVSFLNNEKQQLDHARAERRGRNREDEA